MLNLDRSGNLWRLGNQSWMLEWEDWALIIDICWNGSLLYQITRYELILDDHVTIGIISWLHWLRSDYSRFAVLWGCFLFSYDCGVCWLVDLEGIRCLSCL